MALLVRGRGPSWTLLCELGVQVGEPGEGRPSLPDALVGEPAPPVDHACALEEVRPEPAPPRVALDPPVRLPERVEERELDGEGAGPPPAWSLGRDVMHLFTCENAWKGRLCTRVLGHARRLAPSEPIPPSHTATPGAGTGAISASRALDAPARAMCRDTTCPPSRAIRTTRSREPDHVGEGALWTSPVGSDMGHTRQDSAALLLNALPYPDIKSWAPFDVSHAGNSPSLAAVSS